MLAGEDHAGLYRGVLLIEVVLENLIHKTEGRLVIVEAVGILHKIDGKVHRQVKRPVFEGRCGDGRIIGINFLITKFDIHGGVERYPGELEALLR